MKGPIPLIETVEDARVRGINPVTGKRARIERLGSGEVRVYCVSCHHPGGFISADIVNVIFLCDQFSGCGCDCQHTKGELTLPRLAI